MCCSLSTRIDHLIRIQIIKFAIIQCYYWGCGRFKQWCALWWLVHFIGWELMNIKFRFCMHGYIEAGDKQDTRQEVKRASILNTLYKIMINHQFLSVNDEAPITQCNNNANCLLSHLLIDSCSLLCTDDNCLLLLPQLLLQIAIWKMNWKCHTNFWTVIHIIVYSLLLQLNNYCWWSSSNSSGLWSFWSCTIFWEISYFQKYTFKLFCMQCHVCARAGKFENHPM